MTCSPEGLSCLAFLLSAETGSSGLAGFRLLCRPGVGANLGVAMRSRPTGTVRARHPLGAAPFLTGIAGTVQSKPGKGAAGSVPDALPRSTGPLTAMRGGQAEMVCSFDAPLMLCTCSADLGCAVGSAS